MNTSHSWCGKLTILGHKGTPLKSIGHIKIIPVPCGRRRMEGTPAQTIHNTSTSIIYFWSTGSIKYRWPFYTFRPNKWFQIISLRPSKGIFSAGFVKSSWGENISIPLAKWLMSQSWIVVDMRFNKQSHQQSRKLQKKERHIQTW